MQGKNNETEEMLNKFQEEADAIRKAIERMLENVETMDSMHKQILERQANPEERREAASKISALVGHTKKTSQAIRNRLRRIAKENEEFAKEKASAVAAVRIRISTHQVITQRFMNAMEKFENAQERHQEAMKLAVERQLRILNPDATDGDIESALKRDETDSIVCDSPMLSELPLEEQKRLRAELDFLTSRNKDIRELERNIVELHQMFIDMHLLVEQQGDLLNTIEYNVQDTKGKAEAGMHELVQAYDYQKRARRKKWCVAILFVAIILVILVPVLVKYIPIWFPEAGEAISDVPIFGSGGGDDSSPSPSQSPTQPNSKESDTPAPISKLLIQQVALNSPCAAVGSRRKCR